MSILVDTVRVSGFRGISNVEMSLPRTTLLIGANNSGKTSILKALCLALGDYSRNLSDEDFHIDSSGKHIDKILIDVKIVPVSKPNAPIKFDEEWTTAFEDQIRSEPNGNQYVAIRTKSFLNPIKSIFETERVILEKWPGFTTWATEKIKESKPKNLREIMPFYSIEAQRDIHQELREKSSYVGKVLSSVKYDSADIKVLEEQIKSINDDAVNKSDELKKLKSNLELLNQSFQGSGSAEITPFPKKVRDLSKHFSVHFGDSSSNSFSMEYHGMGTRSWASMLVVKAFVDSMSAKHKDEVKPFFPLISAEEPESHLHPNAQKTLYQQLSSFNGQVFMSSHSPYLAAMVNLSELRYLKMSGGKVEAKALTISDDSEDGRRVRREIVHSRGEILFSKALVFCEGETEEQVLPLLFQKYFNKAAFELGVNFVGVGGAGGQYLPFLKFANDLSIPSFIFSDGEKQIVADLKKTYESVFGKTDVEKSKNITILPETDFEGYLMSAGFIEQVEAAIVEIEDNAFIDNWIEKKHGTPLSRQRTNKAPCKECKQDIFDSALRDYTGADGRKRAVFEILDRRKTTFAPKIAEKLSALEVNNFPPKVTELFDKIKAGVKL